MLAASPLIPSTLPSDSVAVRENGPKVSIRSLRFSYGSLDVFSNLSLELAGSPVLLEGPSGCGKTTLLKILAGLIDPVSAEEIVLPRPSRLVLQDDGLFPWHTVDQALNLVPEWEWAKSERLPLLKSFVAALRTRQIWSLSFGQRRVVELFRVLANPAPLICLDEPLNFLDPDLRRAVVAEIAGLGQARSLIVMSSHHREDFPDWKGLVLSFDGRLPVSSLGAVLS